MAPIFKRATNARAFAQQIKKNLAVAKSWRNTKFAVVHCVKATVPGEAPVEATCFPTHAKARKNATAMKRAFLERAKDIEKQTKKLKLKKTGRR